MNIKVELKKFCKQPSDPQVKASFITAINQSFPNLFGDLREAFSAFLQNPNEKEKRSFEAEILDVGIQLDRACNVQARKDLKVVFNETLQACKDLPLNLNTVFNDFFDAPQSLSKDEVNAKRGVLVEALRKSVEENTNLIKAELKRSGNYNDEDEDDFQDAFEERVKKDVNIQQKQKLLRAIDQDGRGSGLGVEEADVVFTTLFKQAINEKDLKISHISQLGNSANKKYVVEATDQQAILVSRLRQFAQAAREVYPLSAAATNICDKLATSIDKAFKSKSFKGYSNEENIFRDTLGYSSEQKSLLRELNQDIEKFFSDRLFYDANLTEALVEKAERAGKELGVYIDSGGIKHVREEFCLQQAITAITRHAESYRKNFPEDADKAKALVNDLARLTDNFFVTTDFQEDTQRKFLQAFCKRLQQDQQVLARHHGWGDVMENIALAISSIFVVGIIPALFKFYKRTIEGDSTFSYFPSKSESLAKDAFEAAKNITTSNPSAKH